MVLLAMEVPAYIGAGLARLCAAARAMFNACWQAPSRCRAKVPREC